MASFSAVLGNSLPSQEDSSLPPEQQANAWIQQVEQRFATLSASIEHERAQRQDVTRQLNEARAEINRLNSTTPSSSSASIPTTTPHDHRYVRSAKQPDPTPFDGDRAKFETFRSDLRMKLASNADWYNSEQAKLRYCLSRLEGKARKRFEHKICMDGSVDYINTEELFEAFEEAYGDPFKKQQAQRELLKCYQKNRGFGTWFSEFHSLAIDSNHDDNMKRILLEQNASKEYIEKLYMRDNKPVTYQELVKEFQAIENYFRLIESHGHQPRQSQPASNATTNARSQIPRASSSNTTTTVQVQTPSTATGTHAGPMDMSVARGPLSPEEKQRRRANNLCLYCGQPGHIARACPNSNRKPLHVAETNVVAVPQNLSPSSSPSVDSGNGVPLN